MTEWEPVYKVDMLSFMFGLVFGAVLNKTNYCTIGAVIDWVDKGIKGRLRAWLLMVKNPFLALTPSVKPD